VEKERGRGKGRGLWSAGRGSPDGRPVFRRVRLAEKEMHCDEGLVRMPGAKVEGRLGRGRCVADRAPLRERRAMLDDQHGLVASRLDAR
jgi:hypothetical protein